MAATYFAFLDGAFRYDCGTCGQACCRGKGVAISAQQELVPLLSRVPRITSLLCPLPGGHVRLPDVTDGCWFLAGDGFCDYERSHGASAKFATCRMFPFNRVFRVGASQIVDVNSVVCPVEDAFQSGLGVSHTELLAELARFAKNPLLESPVPLSEQAQKLRWLTLETQLRDDSAGFLAAPRFLDYARHMQQHTALHLGLRRSTDEAARHIADLLRYLETLYGKVNPVHTEATSRALLLLSPSLRFNALFRKNTVGYSQVVQSLPAQLLATFALAAQAATVWDRPLTLRGLTELHQAQTDLRLLLAKLREVAVLREPVSAPDLPSSLQQAAHALSQRLAPHKQTAKPLGDVLVEVAEPLCPTDRALLPTLLLRAQASLHFVLK